MGLGCEVRVVLRAGVHHHGVRERGVLGVDLLAEAEQRRLGRAVAADRRPRPGGPASARRARTPGRAAGCSAASRRPAGGCRRPTRRPRTAQAPGPPSGCSALWPCQVTGPSVAVVLASVKISSGRPSAWSMSVRKAAPSAPVSTRWSHPRVSRTVRRPSGPLHRRADAEDRRLRRVDHRVEVLDPEHPEIRDREGGVLEDVAAEPPAGGEVGDLAGRGADRRYVLRVGVVDRRNHQAVLDRDRDPDVHARMHVDRAVAERGVDLGVGAQRQGGSPSRSRR